MNPATNRMMPENASTGGTEIQRGCQAATINAAARMNGLSYSRFINGLKKYDIEINRKLLSEIAVNDADGFAKLAEIAKDAL